MNKTASHKGNPASRNRISKHAMDSNVSKFPAEHETHTPEKLS